MNTEPLTPEQRAGLIRMMKDVEATAKRQRKRKHIAGLVIGTAALIAMIVLYDFWLVMLITLLFLSYDLSKAR